MKQRSLILIGAIIGLVLLLGGAAYVGGRLLNQQLPQSAGQASGNRPVTQGGGTMQAFNPQTEPDERLPKTPADVSGIYLRRTDNSIFVGTGEVRMQAERSQDGQVTMTRSHSGPEVEVVVTRETAVYRDVTSQQFSGPPPSDQKVKQVLESGSIEDLGENSQMTVWGDKRGDRFVAQVLVYSSPVIRGTR